jgi:hypothetical protein
MKKRKQSKKSIVAISFNDLKKINGHIQLDYYNQLDLIKLNYILEFGKLSIKEIDYVKNLIKERTL